MKLPRRWGGWFAVVLIGLALSGCAINFTPEPIPEPFPQDAPLPVSGFELNYEPDLWNDAGIVQNSTNCYAYALDRRTGFPEGHKLQPGELSGTRLASLALVVDPGVDYHWHRQNPDGTWSHKPGHSEVTDLDAAGNTVLDPATADRDYGFINYSEFGEYFCTGAAAGK